MSSGATDTKRQIAIAEGAKDVGARVVDADVAALEAGSSVCCLEALAATRPTLRAGASGVNGRLRLGLRQNNLRACVEPDIDAGALNPDEGAGRVVFGHGAKRNATGWDDVGVMPPLAAEIDGKAATIVVCHGRLRLGLEGVDGGLSVTDRAFGHLGFRGTRQKIKVGGRVKRFEGGPKPSNVELGDDNENLHCLRQGKARE